jgi:hypothetical protein
MDGKYGAAELFLRERRRGPNGVGLTFRDTDLSNNDDIVKI